MSCPEESNNSRYPPIDQLIRMGRSTPRKTSDGSQLNSPLKGNREVFGTPGSTPCTPSATDRSPASRSGLDLVDNCRPIRHEHQTPSRPQLVQRKPSQVDDVIQSSSAVHSGAVRRNSNSASDTKCSQTLNKSPRPKYSFSYFIYILFLFLSLSTVLCYYYLPIPSTAHKLQALKKEVINPEDELYKELVNIQKKFPAQEKILWLTSMAAITSIMGEDPRQPAVLLLVGPNTPECDKTIGCLARRLATVVNKIYGKKSDGEVVNIKDTKSQGHDEVKEEIDLRMRAILETSRALVVSNIEELPPSSAMLLHGYCDNFMAPFKDRVIVLTVLFDPISLDETKRYRLQAQVDRLLRRLWDEELGPDKSASLVSRVANNPIMVVPEPGFDICF